MVLLPRVALILSATFTFSSKERTILPFADAFVAPSTGIDVVSFGAFPSSIIFVVPRIYIPLIALPSLVDSVPSIFDVLSAIQRMYSSG